MRSIVNTGLLLLLIVHTAPEVARTQQPPIIINEVDTMSKDQLLQSIRGECSNPPDCEEFRRREAVRRLAREYPDSFLELASDTYSNEKALAVAVAEAYWELRVTELPAKEREAFLWNLFEGDVEGLIPATALRRIKSLAVDKLCEEGSHDRFDELRNYLVSSWTSIDTVTKHVTYCRERYEAIRDYGSKWDAAMAILEGRSGADQIYTQYWALKQIDGGLENASPELRKRIENALVAAAFRWEPGNDGSTAYGDVCTMLMREFGWNSLHLKERGLTTEFPEP